MNPSMLALWQGCFDGLQEAVWLIDARSHRVLFANAAAARLTLQSAEDFVGRNVLEIAATPQDLAFWNEAPEVIAQGIDSVSSLLRSDGVLLSVERRVSACSFPEAGSVLMMGMLDRSAQQAVQNKLASSLAQLNATLDAVADGILVCGLDGSVRDFNQQLVHLWKIPHSLLAQRDDDGVHAFMAFSVCDPSAHAQRLRELARTPDAPSKDLIALCDGRTLERRSLPQVCQGSVTGRVFSFRDVTAELASQSDLRTAAQVLECSADAPYIPDSRHGWVQLDPAGECLHGPSLHQLQGRKVKELLKAQLTHAELSAQMHGVWARTDPLTCLPKFLMFTQRVKNAVQPMTAGFAVLCVELDRLKATRDSLDHGFGDRVLQLVSARLQSSLRPADMLCRLEGDAFVVYLHECGRDIAEALARRVVDDMGCPFTLDGTGFSVQCSVGVANYPQDGHTLDDLIKHADTAMHHV